MKENLYSKILEWAYNNRFECFTEEELFKKFKELNEKETKDWYVRVFRGGNTNDDCLISIHGGGDEPQYLCLTAKGLSAAIDYLNLDEIREVSRKAEENATKAIKSNVATLRVAVGVLVVSVVVGGFQIWSTYLTRDALELSAEPVLSIVLNNDEIPKDVSPVLIESGFLPAMNNMINLVLENNSLSKVENVSIDMTLWKYYVNKENKHLTICPLGYVKNISNSEFQVSTSSLHTSNSYESSVNSFELSKGREHDFSFNFSEISNAKFEPEGSKILLKIDIRYVKSSSQINHDYVKLYVLDLFNEQIIDIDRAPDHALGLNDSKNNKDVDGFVRPSFVYPFQEDEFLNYFNNVPNKLDFFSVCPEFVLEKERRIITY